jgi:hypothetical protein
VPRQFSLPNCIKIFRKGYFIFTTLTYFTQEMESSSKGGRKLTPLPLNTASTKPGQSQAAVHKLSTTLEEEDESEIDSNENRSQSNLPKNSVSSSSTSTAAAGSAINSNENGNT